MYLSGAKRRRPYADPITLIARRDHASGRFLPQTRQWRRRNLGFDPFSAVAAGFGVPAGGGGAAPMPSGGSPSTTTVSPAIQTTVTPTVSPTFTQIQDSAGARTASSTSASIPTSQSAETRGGDIPGAGSAPSWGGGSGFPSPTRVAPAQSYDYRRQPVNDAESVFSETSSFPWGPLLIGLGIVGAGAAYAASQKKGKR